jgi:hypothetical protein
LNNSIENLEWCSAEDNTRHAHINNAISYPKGEGRGKGAIWKEHEVISIKIDINNGLSTPELFQKYPKLNSKHLYLFRNDKTWTHLKVRCKSYL